MFASGPRRPSIVLPSPAILQSGARLVNDGARGPQAVELDTKSEAPAPDPEEPRDVDPGLPQPKVTASAVSVVVPTVGAAVMRPSMRLTSSWSWGPGAVALAPIMLAAALALASCRPACDQLALLAVTEAFDGEANTPGAEVRALSGVPNSSTGCSSSGFQTRR